MRLPFSFVKKHPQLPIPPKSIAAINLTRFRRASMPRRHIDDDCAED
jgi:hypothetical protein